MNIFLLSILNLCFAVIPIAIIHAFGGHWSLLTVHVVVFNGVLQGFLVAIRIMEQRLYNLKKNLEKEYNIRIDL